MLKVLTLGQVCGSGNKQPVIVCKAYDCMRNLSSFAEILEDRRLIDMLADDNILAKELR